MIDERCICMRLCKGELIAAWNGRARTTLARMASRGRVLSSSEIANVHVHLAMLSNGDEKAFAAAQEGMSLHLLKCPCRGRSDA